MTETVIEIDGVSKSYAEAGQTHPVLHKASLSILKGQFVVLLGKSGSGKSTLLNLVSGIDSLDGGAIRVAGQDIGAMDETARTLFRRQHIGIVFQSFNLIPTLNVLDNLLLPLELTGQLHNEGRKNATALLDELDMTSRQGEFPDRLSTGEQQRVAIARALIHQPEIVLADEPTGNLDLQTGKQVLALLDRLVRQRGSTLLMVTHSTEVASIADRRIHIRDLRLHEDS